MPTFIASSRKNRWSPVSRIRVSLFRHKLLEGWRRHNWLSRALIPVSWIYRGAIAVRRGLYRAGLFRSEKLPVPVVVVGNLTVGGTGKTPLVIWLVDYLRRTGWTPGIVSRGYGGKSEFWPREVMPDSDPGVMGDEPVLLASRCACPVVVGPNRIEDAQQLLKSPGIDILVSDDGLQHYALQRQVEIAIVAQPGEEHNRSMLPAGPYREPLNRMSTVDLVVTRGGSDGMKLHMEPLRRVDGKAGEFLHTGPVHAVAGIAHPEKFFEQLRGLDLDIIEHPFQDHHPFHPEDLEFTDNLPILMTEKDAVKCRGFAAANYWFAPVTAEPASGFDERLEAVLSRQGVFKPGSQKTL